MSYLLQKENQSRPASKQVSHKHASRDRWDDGSSLWPRTGRQEAKKRRTRAEGNAEMESLCFPSGSLDSVNDGKCFYFTHQSTTFHRLHPCHCCVIKHKLSVIIYQVSYVNVRGGPFHRFVQQGSKNANSVTHLSTVGDCAFYFSHLDAIKLQEKLNLCHILSISHPGSQQLAILSRMNNLSRQKSLCMVTTPKNINNRA